MSRYPGGPVSLALDADRRSDIEAIELQYLGRQREAVAKARKLGWNVIGTNPNHVTMTRGERGRYLFVATTGVYSIGRTVLGAVRATAKDLK